MSRVSEYQGALDDDVIQALRAAGADPSTVSIACALGRHDDCDGTLYTALPGDAPVPCRDPAEDCTHGR